MTTPDLDLLDVEQRLMPSLRPQMTLVWAGQELLGGVALPALDGQQAELATARLREQFAEAQESRLALPHPQEPLPDTSRLTIVVCTRDRADLLEVALAHITAMRPAAGEVLVVDNASRSPRTQEVARAAGVRCTVELEPGLDRARNRGWQEATGEFIQYVDDDARAHERLAAAAVRGFRSPAVGAVTGLVVPAELDTYAQRLFEAQGGMGKGYVPWVEQRSTWRHGVQPYRLGVGTNMAFRRSVLSELGGFDPRLDVGTATRGGGDLDMLFRVLQAGHCVAYAPDAVVRHIHRRDWRGLVGQMRDNGTAFAALLAKYAQEDPALARAARRELWSWHASRHVLGPLRTLRRRRLRSTVLLLAEMQGSRSGRRALTLETNRVMGGGGSPQA